MAIRILYAGSVFGGQEREKRIATPVCALVRNDMGKRGAAGETDCHTSDIGHWFAMTGGDGVRRMFSAKTLPGGAGKKR